MFTAKELTTFRKVVGFSRPTSNSPSRFDICCTFLRCRRWRQDTAKGPKSFTSQLEIQSQKPLCFTIQDCWYYTLVARLLARSQYSEGLATGHLDTGVSLFLCVYKRMLRWFPRPQVATACFSCSSPDFNLLDPYFIFTYMHYNHCHRATAHLQLNVLLLLLFLQGYS